MDIYGQASAGCVAVAMGQVMKYYEYPNNYNWDDIPTETATLETATLLHDIGEETNMDYGCAVSVATGGEMITAFQNDFGYTAYLTSYNWQGLKNTLASGKPAIIGGFGPNSGVGHAWVCDGYLTSTDCYNITSIPMFHMLWGADAQGSHNGYYRYNDFTPGVNDFNTGTIMVVNISPI